MTGRVVILYLDEEVAGDGGLSGVFDLRLVPVDDGEFGLAAEAEVFAGGNREVFVSGGCGAGDFAVAAQAEFRLAGAVDPASPSGVEVEGVVAGGEGVGVEGAAVAGVMGFVVVGGLEWGVGVGGLAVLDGDFEVGGGVVADFVES